MEMISRLANYEDFFAYDANYHKTCYSKYITEKNIGAKIRKKAVTVDRSDVTVDQDTSSGSEKEFVQKTFSPNLSDNQILHRAAEILQEAITTHKIQRKFYPSMR